MNIDKREPDIVDGNDVDKNDVAFYVFDYENEEITIPTGIDRIDLINEIAQIDNSVLDQFQQIPEPDRFEDDFETRQRYIAEAARYAGIREGLALVIGSLLLKQEDK